MDAQELSQEQRLETVELGDYIRVVRERKWIIILSVFVVLATVVAGSLLMTPKYRATSLILYQKPSFDTALFGTPIFQSPNKEREVQTGASLVKLDAVAASVKGSLSSPLSGGQLLGMVTVEPKGQTDVVRISAVSTNPAEASQVANAFAEEFVKFRRTTDQRTIAEARQLVNERLDSLSPADASSEYGLMLQEKQEELHILEIMQNGGFEIVELASVPDAPFSPQPARNAILALAVGLVLGTGLAFLFEYLDKRIKDEPGMEREFGLPVLASIPALGGRWGQRSKGDPSERSSLPVGFPSSRSPLLEPFRTLRSNLQYINVDSDLRVILITSAVPQQGKTVTTVNLAFSLALSGERVIIVEADLRRPRLHEYLALSNLVGVTSVLAGTHSFAEAVQLVHIDQFTSTGEIREDPIRLSKNIYCVTSGPLPPNPAELAGSQRMQVLLEKASESADVVLVDSPPLLLVADGLSLAKQVDGVIIAARANETTRDEAHRMISMLERVGANPIGLVVGGIKPRKDSYYYRYGYYQQESAAE